MIWYELVLPVYKQGTDLACCVQECDGDNVAALKMAAARYWKADDMLRTLMKHPRVSELAFSADGHSISVDGPPDLLNELTERELLTRFEDSEASE